MEHELFLQQIETSTPPCERAEDLLAGLRAGRRAVGEAAAAAGARAVAMATPVLAEHDEDFTPKSRYRQIQAEYGEMARQALVCAMHMHVDVASDAEAVRVVDGIRPWLPLLVALGANSPYWQGRDTGHASWRSQVWSRWPTAGPAQPFGDVETYRAVSEQMIGWGAGLDAGMLYFDVRLAADYPTVEIRVADVCTDVEDALLVALLARALVTTVAADPDPAGLARRPAPGGRLAGRPARPVRGPRAPARGAAGAGPRGVRRDRGALPRRPGRRAATSTGCTASFERLVAAGTGATRQRRVHESAGSLRAVVEDLARRTEESWA